MFSKLLICNFITPQNFPLNYQIKILHNGIGFINPDTNILQHTVSPTQVNMFFGTYAEMFINIDILNFFVEKKDISYDIRIQINNEKLFEKIKLRKPFGHRGFIVNIIKRTLCIENNSLHEKIITKIISPVKYQSIDTKLFSKLFNYQEHNVLWMRNLEQTLPQTEIRHSDYIKINNQNQTIYFNINNSQFLEELPRETIKEIQFRGGALIDEMGCGKTACAVTHILTSLPKTFKKISLTSDGYVKTKATLITLPNHISKQWIEEIKKFNPNKTNPTIITIFDIKDYKKYKNKDIINADIVIIPYQFFFNNALELQIKKMIQYSSNTHYYHRYMQPNEIRNGINVYITENSGNSIENNELNIFFFKWHRFIMDECQEMMTNPSYHRRAHLMDLLKSNFRWCLTGTPFQHQENFRVMLNFLTQNSINIRSKHLYISLLKEGIFRRNTKESTKHETKLNEVKITEKVIWVRFSQEERTIYQSTNLDQRNELILRQFCCCPFTPTLLNNCKSFADIITEMKAHYTSQIHRLNHYLANEKMNEQNFKTQYENAIEAGLPNNEILWYEHRFKHHEQAVKKIESEILQAQTSINYYETLNKRLEEKENIKCPVCYSSLGGNSDSESDTEEPVLIFNTNQQDTPDTSEQTVVAMTKCGHLFCSDCINDSLKVNPHCPTCRIHLKSSDVYIVNEVSETEQDEEEAKLYKLVGSKIAKLILYIRKLTEDPENSIIIFAEWENILTRVRKSLDTYGIKTVICKGNKNTRESAIRRFNTEKNCRVIALSSSYASSGTNLTKANKIIFINPIGGDAKHRKDVEDQAIARSFRLGQKRDIEVIRFIVKDSIEETIFKQVPVNENAVIVE